MRYVDVDGISIAGFIRSGCVGPTPAEQATNIVRYLGDEISRSGEKIKGLPENFFATIGSPNRDAAYDILEQLKGRGLVAGIEANTLNQKEMLNVNLLLSGWEQYEAEKKGELSGNYGFIAMKFGDPVLDPFVADVLKPAVKSKLDYDVRDMRDAARAGVIDNIMRAEIRGAAFVIVDLTHDNLGAYWEAGYAEGLGKPVIYICEKAKFDKEKTHFDTNHCTTVMWSDGNGDEFANQLIATLRRSLNLF